MRRAATVALSRFARYSEAGSGGILFVEVKQVLMIFLVFGLLFLTR